MSANTGGPCENTDRELWREREGDYYADSIHVTQEGGIGINCGGYVYVKPVREWHKLAGGTEAMQLAPTSGNDEVEAMCEMLDDYGDGISNEQLTAVAALLRKQAAQIEERNKATWAALKQRDEAYAQITRLKSGYEGCCYACEPVGELNQQLSAQIAEQAAHIKHQTREIELLEIEVDKQAAQIAELRKAAPVQPTEPSAQTSVSPTPADSAARPETE